MLRTTNRKYAGRTPKCGTTNRTDGEPNPGNVAAGAMLVTRHLR